MTATDVGLLDPLAGAAAAHVGDAAVLQAMVDVEAALLGALAEAGAAPAAAERSAAELFPGTLDVAAIAAAGAAGGNPVIPLVSALRDAVVPELRESVHLGATSQDVLDSALALVALRVRQRIAEVLPPALERLAAIADEHRHTPAVGRTLTQQAAPTTAGLRAAVLLDGVVRTWRSLEAVPLEAQLGGSVGTAAVLVDLLGVDRAIAVRSDVARRLGLQDRATVWHVERSGVAALAAAAAAFVGALGRVGLEVAQAARTEVGELDLATPAGSGGSSTLPQKTNPVSAVLLVAAARRAPALAATVLASQLALDDRPPGEWHAEWQPLRELLRLALEAATASAELVPQLEPRAEGLRGHLDDLHGAVHAERAQWALVPVVGRARAAELVRAALASPEFVPGLLALLEHIPDARTAVVRVREVTSVGGPVGLSDRFIDAVAAEVRS